jgi:hypothetical protein
MPTFEISLEDLQKLKVLITDFNSYYNNTWWRDSNKDTDEERQWSFEDVDNQREIGSEIIAIIMPIINKV